MLVWLEYPLPTFYGLIQSMAGFHFATGLDLNIGYLSMPLDEPSKMILIIMPLELFKYQVLPQGVEPATNIFQDWMTSLFSHLKRKSPKIYTYNVLHTCCNSFGDHLKHLETILEVLKIEGMQDNTKKSTWCTAALEFLSFWVTHNGYQPLKSPVEAILAIAPPTNVKHVCIFIGCINFIKNHVHKQA